MRRSIVLLAIGLMSTAAFAATPATVAEPMQLTAADAPEKAVTAPEAGTVVLVATLRATESMYVLEKPTGHAPGGDPDYDGPAPNFASGNPDHDNPMHSLVAQGVDPGSDEAGDGRPNNDGMHLALIPGDDEDGEGDGRLPLAA